MSKRDDRDETETAESEQGLGRRTLLKGGAAAAVAGAGLLAAGAASVVPQREAVAAIGPKRKLIWVVHEIGVWNLPLDVAFNDVAELAGWDFQKVATQPAFTVEGMTKDITAAIQAKPDVLIVTMPGDGILPILKKAQASVDYLAIHHAFNDTLVLEEMPDYTSGFAGEIPSISGRHRGARGLGGVGEEGQDEWRHWAWNPVPGHEFVGKRVTGMKDTTTAFNAANGTSFEAEEFDDKSLDVAAAVPIYKTYIRRHGDDLAGFFGLGEFPDRRHHPSDERTQYRAGRVSHCDYRHGHGNQRGREGRLRDVHLRQPVLHAVLHSGDAGVAVPRARFPGARPVSHRVDCQ